MEGSDKVSAGLQYHEQHDGEREHREQVRCEGPEHERVGEPVRTGDWLRFRQGGSEEPSTSTSGCGYSLLVSSINIFR